MLKGLYKQEVGFTLTELMVVVAIFAILTVISVPAYTEQVAKTRRADAKGALLGLAQAMERYNTATGSFTGAAVGSGGIYPAQAPLDGNPKHYNLAIATNTGVYFRITATPINGGAQDSDRCGTFRLDSAGVKDLTGNTATEDYCGW